MVSTHLTHDIIFTKGMTKGCISKLSDTDAEPNNTTTSRANPLVTGNHCLSRIPLLLLIVRDSVPPSFETRVRTERVFGENPLLLPLLLLLLLLPLVRHPNQSLPPLLEYTMPGPKIGARPLELMVGADRELEEEEGMVVVRNGHDRKVTLWNNRWIRMGHRSNRRCHPILLNNNNHWIRHWL